MPKAATVEVRVLDYPEGRRLVRERDSLKRIARIASLHCLGISSISDLQIALQRYSEEFE